MKVDVHKATAIGKYRQGTHTENSSPRYYPGCVAAENTTGAKAELAFAEWSGLEMTPPHSGSHGDGGVDFRFDMNGRETTIDVKGARKPVFLLVKEAKMKQAADIFVLAYAEGDLVEFIGWEHKSIMSQAPVDKFGHDRCHYRDFFLLRPMFQLKHLLAI